MLSPENIAEDIPFLKKVAYLDSAAVCPPPKRTIEAMSKFYLEYPYNYGVGVFQDSVEVKVMVDKVRERIAQFINASSPEEIIFTKNTTEAINIVAYGLKFEPGDEVIITNIEHQSNIIPWLRLEKLGRIKVKIVNADPEGIVQPEEIERQLTPKTKLVAITHVSNIFGTIQMVEEIGKLVKSHGAIYLVDAAQSAGRMPIDVKKIQCDFMAFCGRKALMGPQGTGFLYGCKDALEKLEPLMVGSRAAYVTSSKQFEYKPLPHRFEAGILNTSGIIGLGTSIEYLQEFGLERIRDRIRLLLSELLETLRSIDGIKIYGSEDLKCNAGIIPWVMEGYNCDDIARKVFDTHRVVVASGDLGALLALQPYGLKGVVRTSVHFFNRSEDITRLKEALEALKKGR